MYLWNYFTKETHKKAFSWLGIRIPGTPQLYLTTVSLYFLDNIVSLDII
jgi:hypothetical protein